MAPVLAQMSWPYEPVTLFEAPFVVDVPHGKLTLADGYAVVVLSNPATQTSALLQEQVRAEVAPFVQAGALALHVPWSIGTGSFTSRDSDGCQDATVYVAGVASSAVVGQIDISVEAPDGTRLVDTKRDRTNAHAEKVRLIGSRLPASSLLRTLVGLYESAICEPASEVARLYDIRDALATHYNGGAQAVNALGIAQRDWNRLGELANSEPLSSGRHKGRHAAALRSPSPEELKEAREIAWRFVEAAARVS